MISKVELLSQTFYTQFGLSGLPWEELADSIKEIEFSKNEIIKGPEDIEKYLYLIVRGSGGTFSYKGEKRVCLELCYENEFFGDYFSLLTKTASGLETMALEKSLFLRIHFQALQEFYIKQGDIFMEQIGRQAAEGLYLLKQQQLIDLQTKTAEERYLDLLRKQKDISDRTSIKHLASYLGITPESLSRIRNKIRS
ncbi:Crp/Fnr family transcriptional regulator [Xanthovirga aplysinae]|uniref:Crp/Fnr family transcriptional regulator n=1 Tax=Xanthovirga aplysinae TaxID=2529853 RepID=UPI0012BCA0B9|nr:Crp/Fnr family transcriptional regulator [Xanthovirga aplysinae]MTI31994.1 Crp/Fnr family transcriptional regulator [Xanthovirga aplysinae]